jgi:acyl-homoserine-lactone acylase
MKFALIIFLLTTFSLSIFSQCFQPINPTAIEIVRDEWGVPHIFAKRDAEVAYGLAWANAEDAFFEMQELLVMGRGMSGRYKGKEGVIADYFQHVVGARETVRKEMKSYPEDFLCYIDGYVQGINAFAAKHKDQVIVKGLFPMTTEDVLVTYVMVLSAMTDVAGAMGKIYSGELDSLDLKGLGSNAFAINSKKSEDGSTMLCTNPHMQMSGTFSFYEAHLESEEGLKMHGALFQGGTSIFMGNNENLGWGMTWNYFKQGDIYRLEMHPKKKHVYKYDDEWLKLDVEKAKLKVKIKGLTIPVSRKVYRSVHGPVLNSSKNKDEFYAFRFPAYQQATAPMQWYRMNKAKDFTEFKRVLEMMAISMFNIVYADREDNIFYVSYGQVPKRSNEIAAQDVLPGNTSKVVWQRIHALSELPIEENPDCNFVYNTNNSPFIATCVENEEGRELLGEYVDCRPGQNNRATVLSDFLERNDHISFQDFQAIKFDNTYSKDSYIMRRTMPFLALDISKYPDVADIFNIFKDWQLEAKWDDPSSAVVMVVHDVIFKQKGYDDSQFIKGLEISEEDFVDALRLAKKWLLKHHERIDVPLKDIFVCQKGDSVFAAPGFPDALAANYGVRRGDKFVVRSGDTYTHFVRFTKDGVQELRTLVPFGNSNHADSPFYMSQAGLFQQQQTKEMTMDKAKIYAKAKLVYHPE